MEKTTIENFLLQFLQEGYNLNDVGNVLDKVKEDMDRKEIIQKHIKEFSTIWQGESNGRWYTYLPDAAKKKGRRLIAKSSEEKIHHEIIGYYKEQEEAHGRRKETLASFYPEWLRYKSLHTDATSYIRRIDDDWKRFYQGTEITKIPLVELDRVTLDEWAHSLIRDNSLTKTQYYNATVIIRQALALAVDKGMLAANPFSAVKVQTKMFRTVRKKPNESQVFMTDEQPLVEKEAWNDFYENDYSACLGIALCFQLGARLGEMVALKWSDIDEERIGCIHIQRMEQKMHRQLPDGTWKSAGYRVVEHTKSEAGNRNVDLVQDARKILEMIREWNAGHGFQDSEYIFLGKDGNRIHAGALNCRIRKYCSHTMATVKTMHKIRKTYISALIDSGEINIDKIRELVGHEDERTTFHNYCYNRETDARTHENIERALSRDKV